MGKTLWMWLLTLAVVMLFSASEAFIKLDCCQKSNSKEVHDIKKCLEQVKRVGCEYHAFLIITNNGDKRCVKPGSPWLEKLINMGKLQCPHIIQHKLRFEVLDDVDLE